MGKECSILIYRVFNDRNSITRNLEEVIEIDAGKIKSGAPFPEWKWCADAPMVDYYDGENLDLTYLDKHFNVRVGGSPVELISVQCAENIYVVESKVFFISLEKTHLMDQYPSWCEMRAHGSYSAIIFRTLPVIYNHSAKANSHTADDDKAEIAIAPREFLRMFTVADNLFLFEESALNLIKEYAKSGDKYAQFALGRYHQCTQADENSHELAQKYICAAYEKGLPEAEVTLAQMYVNGDMDVVDRAKSDRLLEDALNKYCDYAFEYQLKRMIFGIQGVEKNPQRALELLEKIIIGDIKLCGDGEENPMWYYYRGCAKQMISGLSFAKDDYQKAADMGVLIALSDVAIANSYNNNNELVDKTAYRSAIKYGSQRRDSVCCYLWAMEQVDNYDEMPKWVKCIEKKKLIVNLEEAYSLGSFFAAEELGDIYYYGKYDHAEDNQKAWEWYAKGALLHNVACYEKMFDMVHDHYIDAEQDFIDMLALNGARLGSEKLLNETVIRYMYGRMTEFAAEIEQYYEPVFDANDKSDSETDSSGDIPDDDGRFDAYV